MSAVPAWGLVQADGYLMEWPGAFDADLQLFAYLAPVAGPGGIRTTAQRLVGPTAGPAVGSYVTITNLEGARLA